MSGNGKPIMRLYRVTRYKVGSVDEAHGFVIRAASAREARRVAASRCGDEGEQEWTDTTRSRCVALKRHGKVGVVCREFLNS